MNRFVVSLFLAVLVLFPTLSRAEEEVRLVMVRVYFLAEGKGVAVALPDEWQEVNKKRIVANGAPIRFLDEAGRPVEIPVAALQRARETKSVIWAEQYKNVRVSDHKGL